jgi:hypothetical protein
MFYQLKPRFNSDSSAELLEILRSAEEDEIRAKCAGTSSRTFAPSSLRCARRQWFRLRGSEPDKIDNPDISMEYRASVGSARHEIIQNLLANKLGDDWIPIEQYLKEHPIPHDYELQPRGGTNETYVIFHDIPVKFACDGVIRIKGKLYLLEIKTCEATALEKLDAPKEVHIDQIRCYAALLGLCDVLVLYEERLNGTTKCFEVNFSGYELGTVIENMSGIMDMAEKYLAPERLPVGDYMCSNCPYQIKCKEW